MKETDIVTELLTSNPNDLATKGLLLLMRAETQAGFKKVHESIEDLKQKAFGQIASNTVQLSDLNLRVGSIEKSVGLLEQRVGSLEQRIDSLDQRLGSLEQRMGGLEQQIQFLINQVGLVLSKISPAQ